MTPQAFTSHGRRTACPDCYYGGTWHRSGSQRQIDCAEHKTAMDNVSEMLPLTSPNRSTFGRDVSDLSKQRQKLANSFDSQYLEDSLDADLDRFMFHNPNTNTHAELRAKAFNDLETQLKAHPATADELMRESNAIDSITGNIMESRYAQTIGNLQGYDMITAEQDPNIKPPYKAVAVEAYMSGKDSYKERVREARPVYAELDAQNKRSMVKKLAFEFMLKKEYVKETLENPHKEITRLPDAMTRLRLVKEDGTVEKVLRPVEMKLSGRHDSKSVDANIRALMKSIDDRIDVPAGYKLEPAIAITAAQADENNNIKVESRWKNAIKKRKTDMDVVSNEKVFEFLSGRSYTPEDYHEKYVVPIARLAAVRLFRRIHGNIELPKNRLGGFIRNGKI